MLPSKPLAQDFGDDGSVGISEEKQDVMQEWTETWAEYFRRDETKVEAELEVLCSKLRSLAKSLESR